MAHFLGIGSFSIHLWPTAYARRWFTRLWYDGLYAIHCDLMDPLERLLIRHKATLQLGSLLTGALITPVACHWVQYFYGLLVYG